MAEKSDNKKNQKDTDAPSSNEAGATRLMQADQIVDRYAIIASATGFVPVPWVNWGGVLATQVFMVSDLSQKVYGLDFSRERIRSLIIALLASLFQKEIGMRAGRALGVFIPVVGPILGILATPAIAYATTRAVGRVFTAHFEAGGTLLDFNPQTVGRKFEEEYQDSKNGSTQGAAAAA